MYFGAGHGLLEHNHRGGESPPCLSRYLCLHTAANACLPAYRCGHEALQCCSENTRKLNPDSMCGSLQPMIHESLAKVLSVPVNAVRARLTQELKDSQEKGGKVSYHATT